MGKIVVPWTQQEISRRRDPKPHYSRIIGMDLAVFEGWGLTYCLSPRMGDRFWILNIRVWVRAKTCDVTKYTTFMIATGTGKAGTIEDVKKWTDILPKINYQGIPKYWFLYDGMTHMEFKLMRLFTGENRRIALFGTRIAADADLVQAAIEVSEG